MNKMEFEWGATPESDAFFERNPKFYAALMRLMDIANKTFGREYQPKDRLQHIAFNLGETCRVDFLEILFLAVHGWGIGAMKLLRGLYERAVALGYMIKHPEKAERFLHYAAIQEYKMMRAAVDLVGEKAFDEGLAGIATVAEVTKYRDQFKDEFRVPICKKCQEKGTCDHTTTAFSWDEKDPLAQARELGKVYVDLYTSCYAMTNVHIHASLASAMQEHDKKPEEERKVQRRRDADFALFNAYGLLLLVCESQNTLFGLGLEQDIAACAKEWETLVLA